MVTATSPVTAPPPRGLLEIDRDGIFTAPDITENELALVTFNGRHAFTDQVNVAGNGFYRDNETQSFNGDGSEFLACDLGAGRFLLDEIEEDELEALGFDDDDICEDNALAVADPDALEAALNAAAGGPEFNLDDLTDELSGTGLITDQAINNHSTRDQRSYGGDLQFTFTRDIFARGNNFVLGGGYFRGEAPVSIQSPNSPNLDPVTRSTAGLGVGTFVDEETDQVDHLDDNLEPVFPGCARRH